MTSRVIIFHYHLFKNAGTSLDRILKDNFGPQLLTREFSMASQNNTAQIVEWITSTSDGIAYSTHTAMGPIPTIEGGIIVPIIFLRDPVERIISAYHFERKQQAETLGTQLARENDLEGYVRARLERKNDRQCRNFYSHRLASLVPPGQQELERASQALSLLHRRGVVGRVEQFDAALARLADRLHPYFPNFTWRSTRANASDRGEGAEAPSELIELLREVNHDDYRLLELLDERHGST